MSTPHKPVALAELPVVAWRHQTESSKGVWLITEMDPNAAEEWNRVTASDSLCSHAEATRLLAEARKENERLREVLVLARDWAKGDKWRYDPEHHESWEWYVQKLDAALKEPQ